MIDCSQYLNDQDIVNSFPFVVHMNPVSNPPTRTYARKDSNGNIVHLNIASQKCIPSAIYCLKNLIELNIRHTSFYDCEQGFRIKMEYFSPSLNHLGIYHTTIDYLPQQIGKLRYLQSLVMLNCSLSSLSDGIGLLSSLISASFQGNKLSALPDIMRKLKLLKHLILKNNPNLRSVQSLNDLPSLEMLDTRNCQIEEIPRRLPKLIELYMGNNTLTRLTHIETLGSGIDKNKTFHFNMNNISTIPTEIQDVKNLFELYLDDNKLQTLPDEMYNIMSLSLLHIRNNHFNRGELQAIVTRFHNTNPKLNLQYKSNRHSRRKHT